MNNLAKILGHFTYQIYPINDLANGHEISMLLETFEKQKKYFADYKFSDKYTLVNIADYYAVIKICNYRKYLDRVVDSKKKRLIVCLDYYDDILKRFDKYKISLFYKNDYDFRSNKDYIDLSLCIYQELPSYISLLDEDTFSKAVGEHPYLVLQNFSDYNKVFKKYPNLYGVLFSKEKLKEYVELFDPAFVEVISKICHPKSELDKGIKETIIKAIVYEADAIINNKDLTQALHNQIKYKSILKFLKAIEYQKYAFYLNKKDFIENLCQEWTKKYGIKYSFQIPIEDIRKYINNENVAPIVKQITLTHLRDNKRLVHFCVPAMNVSKGLIDYVSTPKDTNDNFSLSVQESLEMYHHVYITIFGMYLCDQKHYSNYLNALKKFIEYFYSVIGKNYMAVKPQIAYWENGLNDFINAIKNNTEDFDKAISCADKTVKLIERILKDVGESEYENNMLFYVPENMTISNLLRVDINNPLKDILSVPFMRYISYCLTQDIDDKGKRTGLYIRNNIMHANIDYGNYNISDTFICIILLTSIVNSFFLYYNQKEAEKQIKAKKREEDIQQTIARQNRVLENIQNSQNELFACKKSLDDCYRQLIEKISIPEEYNELTNINSEEGINREKIKKLYNFLKNEVRISLKNSEELGDYIDLVNNYQNIKNKFNKNVIEYFKMVDNDRKRLFSEDYYRALNELAEEGIFQYNIKTPDIPDDIIYNKDRSSLITELYCLKLRKIYGNVIAAKNELSKYISDVITFIEDEDYKNAALLIFKLLMETSKELRYEYDIFLRHNNTGEFKYYELVTNKILSYCDKVLTYDNWDGECINNVDLLSSEPKHKVNKFDCISLLTLFDNIREMMWLYASLNDVS